MLEIQSPATPSAGLPAIPDNVTLPQFILDAPHPTRPIRKDSNPWLIEDGTGNKFGFEEVSTMQSSVRYKRLLHSDLSGLLCISCALVLSV